MKLDTNPVSAVIQFIKIHPDAKLPEKATDGSVGLDVYSVDSVSLKSGEVKMVPTGLKIAPPPYIEVQVRPRSGLAVKKGITVLNSPGTIDPDYRGELGVILVNCGTQYVNLTKGSRIAQLVAKPIIPVVMTAEVEEFDQTGRGEGGFGSTGE